MNDEAPTFAQQQYVRTGLRETAGVGTSVIVVKAMDRDLGVCDVHVCVHIMGEWCCSGSYTVLLTQ